MGALRSLAISAVILVLVVVLYTLVKSNPAVIAVGHVPAFVQPYLSSLENIGAASQSPNFGANATNSSSSLQGSSNNQIQVSEDYQNESITLSSNTPITLSGSYNKLTLHANDGVKLTLNINGNYNMVTVYGGVIELGGTGNYDAVNVNGATSVNGTMSGNNDQVVTS